MKVEVEFCANTLCLDVTKAYVCLYLRPAPSVAPQTTILPS